MLLDGIWKAKPDPDNKGLELGYHKPECSTEDWIDINVPGHWQENEKLRNYSGVLWYRREFKYIKDTSSNKKIWLVFGGVFYRASVWLNGKFLGSNSGYFFPFKFDITDIIEDNNVLVVRVESFDEHDINSKKQVGGVFYHWDCRDPNFNPGGIWRSVSVVETGIAVFDRVKIVIVDYKRRVLRLYIWITNHSSESINGKINMIITPKNFDGKTYEFSWNVSLVPGKNEFSFEIELPDSKLWWTWDLGFPHVYVANLSLIIGELVSDKASVNFGIRSVNLVKTGKSWIFYLNGKRLFLRGTNYGPTDQRLAHVRPEDIKRDAILMRDANINAVRIHAHVNPIAFDIFDELGILVWQDMPLQWMYSKGILNDALNSAKKLVEIAENHPSIAIICCHNEPFKFPDKKDLTLVLLSIILSVFMSALFGFLSHRIGIFSFFGFNLTAFIRPYTWLDIIVSFIIFSILIPAFALASSAPEAMFLVALLSIAIPWDIALFFVAFLALFKTSLIQYLWNWNKNVLDKKICATIREYDMNSHPLVRASGLFGWFIDGTDTHIYFGWYTGWAWPYRGYKHLKLIFGPFRRIFRFVSEFGAQAFPDKENFLKILPNDLRKLINDNFSRGYPRIAKYLKENHQYQPSFMHLWIKPNRYKNLDEFITATQEWQAELVKYYVEFFRSRKYSPTGGIFQFMFTDIAPLITWAIVDYWRKPKLAYYVLKQVYNPLIGIIVNRREKYRRGKKYSFVLAVVNDFHKAFNNAKLELLIDKNILVSRSVNVHPDSSLLIKVKCLIPKNIAAGKAKLVVRIRTEDSVVENTYDVSII